MATREEEFNSRFSAQYDLRLYSHAKGYMPEGDRLYWQPQDPVDLEPEQPNYGPGAARRGEIEDYDSSDVEEF